MTMTDPVGPTDPAGALPHPPKRPTIPDGDFDAVRKQVEQIAERVDTCADAIIAFADALETGAQLDGQFVKKAMIEELVKPIRAKLGRPKAILQVPCQARAELGGSDYRLCGLSLGHTEPHQYTRTG